MATIELEDIKDIDVEDYGSDTYIDFKFKSGSTLRLELSEVDTGYLKLKLNEHYTK